MCSILQADCPRLGPRHEVQFLRAFLIWNDASCVSHFIGELEPLLTENPATKHKVRIILEG